MTWVELRGFEPLTFCMPCTCHALQFRLKQSEEVRFPQVRALRKSEAVALGLPKPEVVVTG